MTLNSYSSLCDDFYLDMYINTELELPSERDTVLSFFERVQKQYPQMGSFYRRENNEYCLEEDRDQGTYRWVNMENDRIGSGVVNPSNFETAYKQHRLILELVPYMLSVSHLDIDSLDVSFVMEFDCSGNHDEVIAEALLSQSAFNSLMEIPGVRAIGCSPAIVVALSDDERTQGRISIDSKTTVYGPRKKEPAIDEAIGLSFTIRQYPNPSDKFDSLESFEYQCRLIEELMAEKIVPNFVLPLTEVIAQKRLT